MKTMRSSARILWDEQEALLLFDTYDKILHYQDKKSDIINELSINLCSRARDMGISIDDTFRNCAGIRMRLSEVDKIINSDNTGLTKTSELFHATAGLYMNHRRSFVKRVREIDEYRVKIVSDISGFTLLESVILLDAYLEISLPGETKAHTARVVSAKLRHLAKNRGWVINDSFRSESGIVGRLRKIEIAFQNTITHADESIPQIFIDVVDLYYNNRIGYNRLLKQANSIIGKVVVTEDLLKIEKVKQQTRDPAPVKKTKYVKTKIDRKQKDTYS